jgi:hypothetical protein
MVCISCTLRKNFKCLQVNIAFRPSHMDQKCTIVKVLIHTLKNGRDFAFIELYAC